MAILVDLLKELFAKSTPVPEHVERPVESKLMRSKVLNVGGSSKNTPIPQHYSEWQHDLLDIDSRGNPDIVCDARELRNLDGKQYEAIYCSHNLEHYYRHDALTVLQGFVHILKDDGFAEIRVPDIAQVISGVIEKNLDLDDMLYESAAGPITAHDVMYGLQSEIVNSGQDFYAHKTGFTPKSLTKLLHDGGFQSVYLISDEHLGIHAIAFKGEPTKEQLALLAPTLRL